MKTLEKTQYTCPNCKTSWQEQEWTDDHSDSELLCKSCTPASLPMINLTPSWVSVSNRYMPDPAKMDAQGEIRATDMMLEERAKETKISRKARLWEQDRKREFKKNVPLMKKDTESKKQSKIDSIVREVTRKY